MTELAKHGTKRFVTVTDKLSVSRSPIHIEIEFGNPDIVVCPVPVLLIHTGIGDVFGCLQTGTEKFCIVEKRGFQIIVFLVGQEVLLGQQHAHTYTLGTFVTVHRVTVGRVVRINAVGLAVINHIRPVAQVARIVHLLTIADKRYAFVHQIFYIIYYQ